MTTFLVLIVIGEDRPGLVESLSSTVTAHDGNWLESRMARLAGKFAGILDVSVPSTQGDALIQALRGLESEGLTVVVEKSSADDSARVYERHTLEVLGHDRPGIVRDISHALASRGVNVDELHSECTSAPMSGEALFKATAQLRIPAGVSVNELRAELEVIAQDLMVDISLED